MNTCTSAPHVHFKHAKRQHEMPQADAPHCVQARRNESAEELKQCLKRVQGYYYGQIPNGSEKLLSRSNLLNFLIWLIGRQKCGYVMAGTHQARSP